MQSQFQELIQEGYSLFAPYPVRGELDVCTVCCVSKDEEQKLLTTPVQAISSELLATWNYAAKTSHPDLSEFKHFLPRLLELATGDPTPIDRERLLKSFQYYALGDWRTGEVAYLRKFSVCLFTAAIERPPEYFDDTMEYIVMFDNVPFDVSELLRLWQMSNAENAALRYANHLRLSGFESRNAFAKPELKKKLRDWLRSAEVFTHFDRVLDGMLTAMDPSKTAPEDEDLIHLIDIMALFRQQIVPAGI